MDREMITVYCGAGKGKTAAALGQGLMAANSGKSVIVIQFLKGCQGENLELVQRLEPEMKVFRFEKFSANYNDLGVQEQAEESANIKNAFGFAKKVLATGECDLLILDEILGLLDLNLVSIEEMKSLLAVKEDSVGLVVTGIHMKEELFPYVDQVHEIETRKG
ncbi:MAG: cob(I)yrinic acid a,c-diamide adenosyltransferase [Lachnospiraceae bacterium]|jgi:cob(I)alamin adenosyltransferase|nr:cob(I)yrinic acid a,c-diamide adenosyltransferase [Lachnospiraceae bacterium]MCI8994630.1 cob(I)yrinic acid a,c-diamide adenosyltransferase [Lachnospiraceae bacterium]MCI9133301.1 cob(I)yrinic acid a,c-diamide adenosyltransferase [Lachnospiraceae bacterium]